MKNTLQTTRLQSSLYSHVAHRAVLFVVLATVTMMTVVMFTETAHAQVQSYVLLSRQMSIGSRGTDVTNLQTYLAADPALYPQGLITGYYGSLTAAAVTRFQVRYDLAQVGRVGPLTLAKINNLIVNGGLTVRDISGPAIFGMTFNQSSNQAVFGFTSNKPVLARVAYGTSPLHFNEGDIFSNGFGPIDGASVSSPYGMSTTHLITVPNLIPNTTYYYTVIATDAVGNVSVWGPNSSFRTSM